MTDQRSATTIATDSGAGALFGAVGLMADGPVVWGRPVPARGAGVFVVELPATLHHAPVEHTRIGKWLERVPELLLDGVHPTTRALAARLEAVWVPSTPGLYGGTTRGSIGGPGEGMPKNPPRERGAPPGGHARPPLRRVERGPGVVG